MTDTGVGGLGQIESSKPVMIFTVSLYRELLIGEDPTDIERCMLKIRRLGAFKPWGSMVSAIEVALHDLTGKAYGVPVYKLLGGKIRDRVRVYNGGVRPALAGHEPEHYADSMRQMMAAPEGFTIIKAGVGLHGFMSQNMPGFLPRRPARTGGSTSRCEHKPVRHGARSPCGQCRIPGRSYRARLRAAAASEPVGWRART